MGKPKEKKNRKKNVETGTKRRAGKNQQKWQKKESNEFECRKTKHRDGKDQMQRQKREMQRF